MFMAEKGRGFIALITLMPQITLIISQVVFLTVLVGGLYFLSNISFAAYEKTVSPLYTDGLVSSLYD